MVYRQRNRGASGTSRPSPFAIDGLAYFEVCHGESNQAKDITQERFVTSTIDNQKVRFVTKQPRSR